MKKSIILIFVLSLFAYSCEREADVKVSYLVTNAVSGFTVHYLDGSGNLIKENIDTQSAQDKWTFSYMAEEGSIIFVSAKYTDINSAIKVQLKLDGKIYKEGSSTADTIRFVTVSGTIPYD